MTTREDDLNNAIKELETKNTELNQLVEEYRNAQSVSWQQTRTLLSSIPLGLAIVDENGNIDATNTKLRQMFEYDSSELLQKPISNILSDIDLNSQASDGPVKLLGLYKSGKAFATEVTVHQIQNSNENLFFVYIKDISEQQKLDEYKMNLISMVSHDLRTPLTTMRNVLTSLDDDTYGDISSSGKEAIEWALISSNHMQSLLANILDAEKLESGTISIDPQKTSTGTIVKRVIKLCNQFARQSDITLETEITDDMFESDEERVIQIMTNLISNAIKFSKANSTVTIKAGLRGTKVQFEVIDTGPGIPEDAQQMIFERFGQMSSSGYAKKGFGLGLFIAKTLAELQGGNISLESKLGQGSKFTLSIPMEL